MGRITRRPGRIGSWVAALSLLLAIPIVNGWLGDAWDAIARNPVPAILGAAAVLILAITYRDAVLSAFGFQTTRSVDRRLRDWLDAQNYSVRKLSTDPFLYVINGPLDQVNLFVGSDVNPTRIEIASRVSFTPDQRETMKGASQQFMRRLVVDLQTVFLSAPALSLRQEPLRDPADFALTLSTHVLVRQIDSAEFFAAVHVVRRSVIAAHVVFWDAAETVAEQQIRSDEDGNVTELKPGKADDQP